MNEQEAVKPVEVLVAVTITVVVPFGKVEPDAGVATMVGVPPQASIAVGVKVTTAEHSPTAVDWVMFAGQVRFGGIAAGILK